MPTPLFLGLDTEKQQNIFMAGVSEFAEYGYENSSTNRIVKKLVSVKEVYSNIFRQKRIFIFMFLTKSLRSLISA